MVSQTHFLTLFANLMTHGAYVKHDCQAVLIYKMLPEEDRVLIKVLKSWKRIRNVNHLKERLTDEWRHVDHCIIDRAVNQVNQWQKRLRSIRENGGHFQH